MIIKIILNLILILCCYVKDYIVTADVLCLFFPFLLNGLCIIRADCNGNPFNQSDITSEIVLQIFS